MGVVSSGIVVEEEQIFDVNSGLTVLDTQVNEYGTLNVNSGGVASSTTVNQDGYFYVNNGGVASITTVTCAEFVVNSGGVAINTTANDWANFYVNPGAVASSVNMGGTTPYLKVSSGGKLTGSMTFGADAQLSLEAGAILDFDISAQAPGAGALVNNLSKVSSSPTYTITVDANQTEGTYALAAGAAGFAGTLTLGSAEAAYGTITVNGDALSYGDYTYTLTLSGEGALNLDVASSGGAVPTSSGAVITVGAYAARTRPN